MDGSTLRLFTGWIPVSFGRFNAKSRASEARVKKCAPVPLSKSLVSVLVAALHESGRACARLSFFFFFFGWFYSWNQGTRRRRRQISEGEDDEASEGASDRGLVHSSVKQQKRERRRTTKCSHPPRSKVDRIEARPLCEFFEAPGHQFSVPNRTAEEKGPC